MSADFSLDFPRASSSLPAKGVIKERVEDFYVEEILQPELTEQGEHVWLWVEKKGQNTEFVAEQIAKYACVKPMDVGVSGLKDRWALTRQWFSVYLGKKVEPDWALMGIEGVTVLQHGRSQKKLRRGTHSANKFIIVIRNLEGAENIENELSNIASHGFPNYFGAQRFGFNGANLERGERFFSGKIKASRSQRSFYLSAARSFLFNLNLAKAIKEKTWLTDQQGGPLYGDEVVGRCELTQSEKALLELYPVFAEAIHKNRLKLERRPFAIIPEEFSWERSVDSLTLSFILPSGTFATSLISELMNYQVGLGMQAQQVESRGDA